MLLGDVSSEQTDITNLLPGDAFHLSQQKQGHEAKCNVKIKLLTYYNHLSNLILTLYFSCDLC